MDVGEALSTSNTSTSTSKPKSKGKRTYDEIKVSENTLAKVESAIAKIPINFQPTVKTDVGKFDSDGICGVYYIPAHWQYKTKAKKWYWTKSTVRYAFNIGGSSDTGPPERLLTARDRLIEIIKNSQYIPESKKEWFPKVKPVPGKENENWKQPYILSFQSKYQVYAILKAIQHSVVIKRPQVDAIIDYIEESMAQKKSENEMKSFAERLSKAHGLKSQAAYQEVIVTAEDIEAEWVAGQVVGDGLFTYDEANNMIVGGIASTSSPQMLKAVIKKVLDEDNKYVHSNSVLRVTGPALVKFINYFIKYMDPGESKCRQGLLTLKFYELRDKHDEESQDMVKGIIKLFASAKFD